MCVQCLRVRACLRLQCGAAAALSCCSQIPFSLCLCLCEILQGKIDGGRLRWTTVHDQTHNSVRVENKYTRMHDRPCITATQLSATPTQLAEHSTFIALLNSLNQSGSPTQHKPIGRRPIKELLRMNESACEFKNHQMVRTIASLCISNQINTTTTTNCPPSYNHRIRLSTALHITFMH